MYLFTYQSNWVEKSFPKTTFIKEKTAYFEGKMQKLASSA
jgi:hypothetical protein